MINVAFKILLHDKAKYLALILGIAFATLLISQQAAIFIRCSTPPPAKSRKQIKPISGS